MTFICYGSVPLIFWRFFQHTAAYILQSKFAGEPRPTHLNADRRLFGELMLSIVQIQPDLAHHPLDGRVVPLPVVQPRRIQPQPQVGQRILQATINKLQPRPANLSHLRQHKQAIPLFCPKGQAVHPGDLNGIQPGVEDGIAVAAAAAKSLRGFELFRAVFAAPAGRTGAHVAAPAFAAAPAVLAGVWGAEFAPLGASHQRPVVQDVGVEVDKMAVDVQVADAAVQRGNVGGGCGFERVVVAGGGCGSGNGAELQRRSEVEEGVAGVEEGGAVGGGGQVGGVGTLPRLAQCAAPAALLQGQVRVAVVQNEDCRPEGRKMNKFWSVPVFLYKYPVTQ